MPNASVVASSPDTGSETVSITLDSKPVPGAGVAAGATGPDRETIPTPSDYERVPGTGSNAGDSIFEFFNEWGGDSTIPSPGISHESSFRG